MPIAKEELELFQQKAMQLRQDIIDVTFWGGGGHIGGSLSLMDILIVLYYKYANIDPKDPNFPQRDRILVSKAHAGIGIAALLADRGYFDRKLLKDFNRYGSLFGIHLSALTVPGVDASTGSLGHGLPMSVGFALGARLKKESWKVYCILGDGECHEGSNWEAAMSINQFKLFNVITIVDRNRLCLDGKTEDIMGLEPFKNKWESFGFKALDIDGHNFNELSQSIEFAQSYNEKPVVIVANTVKGKGISSMENDIKWHYGVIDQAERLRLKGVIQEYYSQQ